MQKCDYVEYLENEYRCIATGKPCEYGNGDVSNKRYCDNARKETDKRKAYLKSK